LKGRKLSLEGTSSSTFGKDETNSSAVTLDECVRNLIKWTSCSVAQAVECVTAHPAALLGISEKKGSLRPGLDADLVVIDDAGNLYQTWKFGEKVHDVNEPKVQIKQELKKVSVPRRESIPFGERFTTVSDTVSELVRVVSPSGVKVH